MPIRVLLVDDNDALRAALRGVVDGQDDLAVVADAATAAAGVEAALNHGPDVVVMDIDLPDGRGPDVVAQIRAGLPGVGVVYFSGEDLNNELAAAIGDDLFLHKNSPSAEILAAIRQVAPVPTLPLAVTSPDRSPPRRPQQPPQRPPRLVLAGLLADLGALSAQATGTASELADADELAALEAILELSGHLARAQQDLAQAISSSLARPPRG